MKTFPHLTPSLVCLLLVWFWPAAFAEITYTGTAGAPSEPLSLWYRSPAREWMTQALPLGNGRLGAMVFGDVSSEHVQFNDKTLWTGSPTSRGSYQNFGDLYLDFAGGVTEVSEYRRELSLPEAISRVTYTIRSTTYTREYFCSYPDNALVLRLSSTGSANLGFVVKLADAHPGLTSASGNTIRMSGKLDLISYEAQVKVLNEGGSLTISSNHITVANANAVTIILVAGTDYSPTAASYLVGTGSAGLHSAITRQMSTTSAKTYDLLKTNHLDDYQPLFNRVSLNLKNGRPSLPTDRLLANFRAKKYDTALEVLYFQYARFFTLASSRGLALPSNLQGLWNDNNKPSSQCDIHNNINVEMNYWPTEILNLSECHKPFIEYIYNEAMTQPSWRKQATAIGCKGWAMNTQNNIFGYTDWKPDRPANAWYCMHLWQHYIYTLDTKFLASTAYPVMKSACDFWLSRLIASPDGILVAPGEWSPEQTNPAAEDGVSYAQQLIWDLFTNTIKASAALNIDASYRTELESKLAKLDPGIHVGSWGELREWKTTEDTKGDTHPHLSPLVGLYPGQQISPLIDPAQADAARVLLTDRGDGSTGWSCAWRAGCWARLLDGNHALSCLRVNLLGTSNTASNLFDSYPQFQIDGNFGAAAAMTEMLLQSDRNELFLLPALPDAWDTGSVSGLCAQGAFEVGIDWNAKTITKATILSKKGGTCSVRSPLFTSDITVVDAMTNAPRSFIGKNDTITFATVAGASYKITPGAGASITDGTYKIINRGSGKALTVVDGSTAGGANIEQRVYTGKSYQQWSVKSMGGGQYRITGVGSRKSLDVNTHSIDDGAYLQIWRDNGRKNQRWTLSPTSGGFYTIMSVNSSKVIDLLANPNEEGANVVQRSVDHRESQQWRFQAP